MTPRPYSMNRRAAAAADTRRRVIDAAVALHATRGILGAKPADIAAQADVTLTTYYKHFPDRSTLVNACTARAGELVPPPDLTVIARERSPARRIAAAVRLLFDYCEAREPWIYAGRTEERYVPEVGPIMARLRGLRDAAAAAAVGSRTPPVTAIARTLLDFWSWRTLRRDVGATQPDAVASVARTIQMLTARSRR